MSEENTGRTGLHAAALADDAAAVEKLLASGSDPNAKDAYLQTPLILAAEKGSVRALSALCAHSATRVDQQDSFGRSALHWSCQRAELHAVELLLQKDKVSVRCLRPLPH